MLRSPISGYWKNNQKRVKMYSNGSLSNFQWRIWSAVFLLRLCLLSTLFLLYQNLNRGKFVKSDIWGTFFVKLQKLENWSGTPHWSGNAISNQTHPLRTSQSPWSSPQVLIFFLIICLWMLVTDVNLVVWYNEKNYDTIGLRLGCEDCKSSRIKSI